MNSRAFHSKKKPHLLAEFENSVRSKTRVSGFDRVNSDFFKKSKRHRFSKKKKKSTGCNRVFDRVLSG
jgi:hypothetical protein